MRQLLIIDDSPLAAEQLAATLETRDELVIEYARSAADGLARYRDIRPDLVLLDVTMPGRGGLECLRDIMADDPRARVLMLHAGSDPSLIAACLRMGALGIVPATTGHIGPRGAPQRRELAFQIDDALVTRPLVNVEVQRPVADDRSAQSLRAGSTWAVS